MKQVLNSILFLFVFGISCAQSNSNSSTFKNDITMNAQENQSVEKLLKVYESALNDSDTKAILKLYTTDGVFMPSEAPTSVGIEQVEKAYDYVFSQIKLNIVFTIDEIVIQNDMAFARTISRGTTDVLAAGISIPDENRELFVLQKVNGEWKIARYIFNKMSPPAK